jgi:hypothetical protein
MIVFYICTIETIGIIEMTIKITSFILKQNNNNVMCCICSEL